MKLFEEYILELDKREFIQEFGNMQPILPTKTIFKTPTTVGSGGPKFRTTARPATGGRDPFSSSAAKSQKTGFLAKTRVTQVQRPQTMTGPVKSSLTNRLSAIGNQPPKQLKPGTMAQQYLSRAKATFPGK
jgi:hypothetical protein